MTDDITYIANSRRSWGKGDYETQALQRMLEHWHGDFGDTESIDLIKCEGFERVEQRGAVVQVHADEVLSEEELDVDGETLEEIDNLMGDIEILAEEALVEASEE